jgi:hypothetical protein
MFEAPTPPPITITNNKKRRKGNIELSWQQQ